MKIITPFAILLSILIPPNVKASEFTQDSDIYIVGSLANVRTYPLNSAPIAARLPIGTKATFVGSQSEMAERPNKECNGGEEQKGDKWSCICLRTLSIDYGVHWCGWVSKELISKEKPILDAVISEYDDTHPEKLSERRRLAERAVSLNPLHAPARERLLDTLLKLNDKNSLESTKQLFKSYDEGRPSIEESKKIYALTGDLLEPVAEINNQGLKLIDSDQSINHDYRNRGRFYITYSSGHRIGKVATELNFYCSAQRCPHATSVRTLTRKTKDSFSTHIATNFEIADSNHSPRALSRKEQDYLRSIAIDYVKSMELTAAAKSALLESIKDETKNPIQSIGSIGRDGKIMLIGNWVIGMSMNAAHYGDENAVYESLLLIAEQQKDGSFRLSSGPGSIAERGCSFANHLDIDGDGVDELLLLCEQLEGQYHYALAKRLDGQWKVMHGPSRN